jgi:hypothetical protein
VFFFLFLILFFSHLAIAVSHATRMILSLGARFEIQKGPGGRLKGFINHAPSLSSPRESQFTQICQFRFL